MHALIKITLFCSLILFAAGSCKKKKVIDQAAADENTITKYLSDNKLTATATGSGLHYTITTQGTGIQPSINSFITVNYKGYLTNGTIFDQSSTGGFSSSLTTVIKGWQEGIPLFKKGGKGKLFIPSALGYGTAGSGSIPGNAVLIFDIELLDVK